MRALLIVLDSVGCGEAPDATAFGDVGANTLGHLLAGAQPPALPTLYGLGLWKIVTGDVLSARSQSTGACWGRMRPVAQGKDSTTGHWEIAGAILKEPFATFPRVPEELAAELVKACRTEFLGGQAASGTAIIEELGEEHLQSGLPILYTSADSVLQIAAHEEVIPPRRLEEMCRAARRVADRWRVARVIARPFEGEPGSFRRTAGRHDYSMVPPRTVLNSIVERGLAVHGIGKVAELFARSGITRSTPTASNAEGMAAIEAAWSEDGDGLTFANLVDFDTVYGHRRNAAGYTAALVEFDRWLSGFLPAIEPEDLVIITADHGNDPTYRGTDHTREEVPLLVLHHGRTRPLGTRATFADVAATLAAFFKLPPWHPGRSFLPGR